MGIGNMVDKNIMKEQEAQMLIREISAQWKEWAIRTNTKKFVIGVSGGKDSSVVLALAVKLFGKENVVPVSMPQNEQKDIEDVYTLLDFFDMRGQLITINIGEAVNSILDGIVDNIITYGKATEINLPARIRMSTLYAVAQAVGGKVINTCNLSEDVMGWSTFFGDDCGAYGPLRPCTCTEVMAMGKVLGLPEKLYNKTPSDGLCGSSDEEAMGVTYAVIDKLIREGKCDNYNDELNIRTRYEKNKFKTEIIRMPQPVIIMHNYLKN